MGMKTIRRILVLALCAALLLALSGCSSGRSGKMNLYADGNKEEILKAAKEKFSTVEWAESEGAVGEDDKYVVRIGSGSGTTEQEAKDGKRYSVYVKDDGSGDIIMAIRYRVGTTENCVFKGNVVDGEMDINRTVTITADGETDTAKRAGLIFSTLDAMMKEIEGK